MCSGSGHSRPQRELTVSATFRSSRRQRDRDADDRSQGSADVARRMCVARWFPERQLNRCRGHWASKTNRMSAAHGAGLTHPTRCGPSPFSEAVVQRHRLSVGRSDRARFITLSLFCSEIDIFIEAGRRRGIRRLPFIRRLCFALRRRPKGVPAMTKMMAVRDRSSAGTSMWGKGCCTQ